MAGLCGKELTIRCLTHYQMTNFRPFKTERVCRRQFQIWWKCQKVIQMGRKHCGKRRNCWLWAISPFPIVFSKKACFLGASKGVIVWEWVNAMISPISCQSDPKNTLVDPWPKQSLIFLISHLQSGTRLWGKKWETAVQSLPFVKDLDAINWQHVQNDKWLVQIMIGVFYRVEKWKKEKMLTSKIFSSSKNVSMSFLSHGC